MTRRFRLTGLFHNEDYFISLNVGIIEAKDRESADSVSFEKNMGTVFFESESANIFHEIYGEIRVLDSNNVNYCEILQPRENIAHEMIMGFPLYENDDFRKINFNELIKATFKESIERNKTVISFENIAYELYEYEIFEDESRTSKQKCKKH